MRLDLVLFGDGRLFLDRDTVTEAELGTKLTSLRAQAANDAPVSMRGDRSIPYGDVMRVMGRVSAAGVAQLSLIAEGENPAPTMRARSPMPAGAERPGVPYPNAITDERLRGRRPTVAAAVAAAVLHMVVLLPLIWLVPRPMPPETITTVEITSVPEASAASPTPEHPVMESTSNAAALETTRAIDNASDTVAPPSPPLLSPVQAAPPEPVTASSPPPEPAPSLASAAPAVADASAELLHAEAPELGAAMKEALPRVVPAPSSLPQRAPSPVTHPARPIPPRHLARPAPPQREVTQAMEQTLPVQPAPVMPSPTSAAAPAPEVASNAVPTWRGELIRRLQQAKHYPNSARARGEQGVAMASFMMDRAGHVLAASLVRSSGSAALDEEAVAMIHRAEPLPPIPAEMAGATVTLTVPVSFALR